MSMVSPKRNAQCGALLLTLLAVAAAHARDTRGDERELLRNEAMLCRAFEAGDTGTLRRYMDRTFTLTSSRGEVTDFAQNLAEVGKREPHYDVFRNHDQSVRLYGDSAVVLGITTIKGSAGGEPIAADFQYTDTWIRRDGVWRIVASHASRLTK